MARGPAGTGWRIPMVPFGSVAFPMVVNKGLVGVEDIRGLRTVGAGTKGVTPAIGVKGESPGFAIDIGVNMPRLAPGIVAMVGITPIPAGRRHKYVHPLNDTVANMNVYKMSMKQLNSQHIAGNFQRLGLKLSSIHICM